MQVYENDQNSVLPQTSKQISKMNLYLTTTQTCLYGQTIPLSVLRRTFNNILGNNFMGCMVHKDLNINFLGSFWLDAT